MARNSERDWGSYGTAWYRRRRLKMGRSYVPQTDYDPEIERVYCPSLRAAVDESAQPTPPPDGVSSD